MSTIDRFLGLLPTHLQAPARALLHLIWIRADLRFLYASLLRLQQLLRDYPRDFPKLVHEHIDSAALTDLLDELPHLLSPPRNGGTPEERRLMADVLADPAAEALRHPGKHPNSPRISAHPLQTALLTARGEADPLRPAHDRITAMYTGRAIANHIKLTNWDWYLMAADQIESTGKQAERHASAERNAMLAIRTLQNPATPGSIVRDMGALERPQAIQTIRMAITGTGLPKTVDEHLRYLQSFLAERHRRMGERDESEEDDDLSGSDDDSLTTPVDKQAEQKPQTPCNPATFHKTGLADIPSVEEEEYAAKPEQIDAAPNADLEQKAIDNDVPVDSLRRESRIYLAKLKTGDEERVQDDVALSVVTHNQAMLIRRQNQLQRTPDYVPLDLRRRAIAELMVIGQPHDEITNSLPVASAAAVYLASIATGRSPDGLANGGLQVIRRAEDLSEDSTSVAYVLDTAQWIIRVRIANTSAVPVMGARPVHNWLTVPDLLDCETVMRRFTEEAAQGWHSHLDSAMRRVNQQLRSRTGLHGAQLGLWLPRALLEKDGCYATLAQLTEADVLNSSVDLHYLTVSRRGALLRYVAGMRHLLGAPALTHQAADHVVSEADPGFIGMPNTPHWTTVMTVVRTLAEAAFRPDLSPQERHNAYTLYTIFMITFAIGRRHAIDVDVRMQWVGETPIALFHEKGETRLLVVPDRLQRQLSYYQQHRAVVAAWSSLKPGLEKLGTAEFFLISPEGPVQFRPSRFSEYVRALGGDFQLPLNSLRRLVYSELVDAGLGGIVLDAFMGHAAYGREPLVAGSALRLGALARVADEVNVALQRHGWEPLRGPFHA